MDLKLEAKYVYDIIESCLKDYDSFNDKYCVASDKKMAFRKSFIKVVHGINHTNTVTVGVAKNKSKLYVEFKDDYSLAKEVCIDRPWFKGRSYHNSLIKKIRTVVSDISNRQHNRLQEKMKEEFIQDIRGAVPGALNNAVDDMLINGNKK
jgi:hypothetical protein